MSRSADPRLAAPRRDAERSGLRAQIADYQARFAKAQATTETLWVKTRRADGSEGGYFATCYDPTFRLEELAAIAGSAASADHAELERNGYVAQGVIQAKFWDVPSEADLAGSYSDRRAVFQALRAHKSFDVFANQLDGLWAWIAMGEDPGELMAPERVRMILETVYANNRVTNGWATQRTADGGEVESDQGKDVWIATNYVLAQMLDYCGMTEESKEVYQVMDEVLLQRDNTSTSPESIRPDENKFIVKGYPRPGAVWTQLPLFFLKARRRDGGKNAAAKPATAATAATGATAGELADFIRGIFNPPASVPASRTSFLPVSQGEGGRSGENGGGSAPWGRSVGRLPYGLGRIRPGAAAATVMPGGGGTAGSVLA